MFDRDCGCNGVDLQPAFPGQDPKSDGGPDHGIDEQDHQHRMQQPHPGMEAEDLIRQSNGLAQPSLPDPPRRWRRRLMLAERAA